MNALLALDLCEIFWLGFIIVMVVAELAAPGLVTIWFAAGGVIALIFAIMGFPVLFQIFIFLLVSAVLLAFTRPMARKLTQDKKTATNVSRFIGQKAIVTETVNNLDQTGRAVVLGQDWSIRTEIDTDVLEAGTLVEVLAVKGAKLIVKNAEEE